MPDTDLSRSFLAAALGKLGRVDEARKVWMELEQVNPDYSFENHINRLPFKNPAAAKRIADGLRRAELLGWPKSSGALKSGAMTWKTYFSSVDLSAGGYIDGLSIEETAQPIATGVGIFGSSLEYFKSHVDHFETIGIENEVMVQLFNLSRRMVIQ